MSQISTFFRTFFTTPSNIYIFIIVGLIIFIMLRKTASDPAVLQDQQKIDTLDNRVTDLAQKIKDLSPQLNNTQKSIDSVKVIVKSNDLKIKTVQIEAKKRDSIISTLNTDQLKKYFSDYE